MNFPAMIARPLMLMALAALLGLAVPGCGFGKSGDDEMPTSGDPEADRRADMRVGSDDDRKKGSEKDDRTLYERLGGGAGISKIVDDVTDRSLADPRVNFERKDIDTKWIGGKYEPWQPTPENVERFKRHMVEFLTLASGGPAEYTGREMRIVHKGMNISNSEFDAMVGDIKISMDKLGIASREKRDLLAIIETTRKQIVEKQ
jgi:hemoglobin